jgi:DNA-binding NarL/FixJ family response regulator
MEHKIIETDILSTKRYDKELREPAKALTIAIIDEYPIARTGLRSFLSKQLKNERILESKSIEDFHSRFMEEQPDIIILGIGQNLIKGHLDDLYLAKKWYKMGTIIVYDDSLNLPMIRHCFKIGIGGYLSKQSHPHELIKCIRSVITGLPYISTETLIKVRAPQEG